MTTYPEAFNFFSFYWNYAHICEVTLSRFCPSFVHALSRLCSGFVYALSRLCPRSVSPVGLSIYWSIWFRHLYPAIWLWAFFEWRWKTRLFLWNAFTAWTHNYKFYCPTREWAKWVSEPVNGASERSERCERTNVASDRVAHLKRDNSVNTYAKFQLSYEGVSEVSERACERSWRSKRSEAERLSRVSGSSKQT